MRARRAEVTPQDPKAQVPVVTMIRCLCALYWSILTVLLLVPDPLALLPIPRIAGNPTGVGTHFLVFAPLGVLVAASRLPLGRVLLAALLIGYAAGTELLQSLVRARAPELRDFFEDVLGLAAGIAIWWVAQRRLRERPNGQGSER